MTAADFITIPILAFRAAGSAAGIRLFRGGLEASFMNRDSYSRRATPATMATSARLKTYQLNP